jgi:hypothetical protein
VMVRSLLFWLFAFVAMIVVAAVVSPLHRSYGTEWSFGLYRI